MNIKDFIVENNENTLILGVDEAGRGPVIGDMVVACVLIKPRALIEIEKSGLRESKQLGAKKRRYFYREILKKGVVAILVYVHPWRIDRENLNDVEVESISWIMKIVQKIICNAKPDEIHVYVDEIKGRAKILKNIVEKTIGKYKLEFIMEPNADVKYPAVAIASIFAKVSRDKNLEVIKKLVGDIGSGYPADLKTRDWLLNIYNADTTPPLYVRRSWSILRNIAPKWYTEKKRRKEQRSLLDFIKR